MTTTTTRHEILTTTRNAVGFGVMVDRDQGGQAWLDVVSNERGTGYAHSQYSGMVYRFRPLTGRVREDGMVRVVVTPAVDSGDADGTLIFDEATESHRGDISAKLLRFGPVF
jgi:hypothetical protein